MTVYELIQILQTYDPKMTVYCDSSDAYSTPAPTVMKHGSDEEYVVL